MRKINVASLPHTRMQARIRKAIAKKLEATVSTAKVTWDEPPVIQAVPRPTVITPPEPPNHPLTDSSEQLGPQMTFEEHGLNHNLSVGYAMAQQKRELDMSAHAGLSENKIAGIEETSKRKAAQMIGESSSCTAASENAKMSKKKQRSWLMTTLAKIMATKSARMKDHKCIFENTTNAASHNGRWLKHYKWDLTNALTKQAGTMIDPGSEFRSKEVLKELWGQHKHWSKMEQIISVGLEYPLEEISEEDRKKDLVHMMALILDSFLSILACIT